MNEAVGIKDRIIAQFKNIDGTGNYNNSMNSNYVSEKWLPVDAAPGFPYICLSMVDYQGQENWDQASYTRRIVFDFLAYDKSTDSEADDCLDKAMKLQQDMEIAIMADPELNEQGFNTTITSQVGAIDPFGIVSMRINVDFDNTY